MGNMPINEVFREKRKKEGISTEKIFNEAHIPSKFIYMMENGEWENFPSKLHMKGFIRIYADYLKIPKGVVEEGLREIMEYTPADDNYSKDALSGKIREEKIHEKKPERALRTEKSAYFLLLLTALFIIIYLVILYILPK